ncbi:MAG: aldo/keto reductase [Planctomycetota bacterium]|jgi:2,5-diketo-D-gluconate reductase A|nr:aldo/keto reductase [Planctomycetota bacterium]
MTTAPTFILNDGKAMPQLGFGVWQISDAAAAAVIKTAVSIGYRSIDTAAYYKNEIGVGRGVRECGVDRKDLFVTTKLWNTRHGYDEAFKAFDESMERLGLDYIDLYLIHWPVAGSEKYVDAWKAFVKLRESGRVKSIGVSNFMEEHLERIIGETGVKPVLDQIEIHPFFQQKGLTTILRDQGIFPEAWSPLGKGKSVELPAIIEMARKYGKSPAQIIIRWHLQSGRIVIPKSANPGRLRENFEALDFVLDDADVAAMDALDRNERMDMDPRTFTGLDLM